MRTNSVAEIAIKSPELSSRDAEMIFEKQLLALVKTDVPGKQILIEQIVEKIALRDIEKLQRKCKSAPDFPNSFV